MSHAIDSQSVAYFPTDAARNGMLTLDAEI